jgi:hypothetical protein
MPTVHGYSAGSHHVRREVTIAPYAGYNPDGKVVVAIHMGFGVQQNGTVVDANDLVVALGRAIEGNKARELKGDQVA